MWALRPYLGSFPVHNAAELKLVDGRTGFRDKNGPLGWHLGRPVGFYEKGGLRGVIKLKSSYCEAWNYQDAYPAAIGAV